MALFVARQQFGASGHCPDIGDSDRSQSMPACHQSYCGGLSRTRDRQPTEVFYLGLLYTLGRTVAYSALGAVLIFLIRKGEDAFGIQDAISTIGEWILGPALVLIGLFMLFGHLLHLPKFGFSGQASGSWTHGVLGAFILGVLFAMAFCPTSGMLYFGMLIPMSAVESGGYALPVVYAIATSLPVLVAAWIIAYSMQSLGKVMGKIAIFQRWFNRLVAILFILVGLYYTVTILL